MTLMITQSISMWFTENWVHTTRGVCVYIVCVWYVNFYTEFGFFITCLKHKVFFSVNVCVWECLCLYISAYMQKYVDIFVNDFYQSTVLCNWLHSEYSYVLCVLLTVLSTLWVCLCKMLECIYTSGINILKLYKLENAIYIVCMRVY